MAKGKGKMKQATDAELFAVDATGDDRLRRQLGSSTWDSPAAAHPRKGSGKLLKSEEILAMRSRVPARTSKVVPGVMVKQKKDLEKRGKITPLMKRRLRSMVKRDNAHDRGLWDVSAGRPNDMELSSAVTASGSYDPWTVQQTEASTSTQDVVKAAPNVKPPSSLRTHALLSTVQKPSAVLLPHPGQSYNPTFEDHQALLAQEHAKALKEEEDAEKARQVKEAWLAGEEDNPDAYATGYAAEVGEGDDEEEDNIEGDDDFVKKVKKQKRKTDKEKKRRAANKALEAHTRAQTRLAKSQRQALSELSRVVSSVDSSSSISLSQLHKRKTMLANKLAMTGLTDLRSGPAKVPKAKQALLLSEELPESLRQLKTDGNLWGDWLDSSRRRGKVQMERKPYGRMTKKKGRGLKSIEKVAWRKFEA